MEIHELSNPLHTDDKTSFHFGVDPVRVASKLREIADSIDDKSIIVTKTIVYGCGDIEDFAIQTLILKFAERREPSEPKFKSLRGAGEVFPIAVAKTE